MELLGTVTLILGLVTGVIAVAEKMWGVLPHRGVARRHFRRLYRDWQDNGHVTTPTPEEVHRFTGYVARARLKPEEMAFALQAALYTGDPSMHALLMRNRANSCAVEYLAPRIAGPGIRSSWRTEYALTQLPAQSMLQTLFDAPDATSAFREAARRVLDQSMISHLRTTARGDNPKLRAYATEVPQQVGESIEEDVAAQGRDATMPSTRSTEAGERHRSLSEDNHTLARQ